MQAQFNPMNIYQSNDPFGISSGFMARQPESIDQIKKELEAIQKSAETIKNVYDHAGAKTTPSGSSAPLDATTNPDRVVSNEDSWTRPQSYSSYASSDIHLGVNLSARQI